MNASFYRKKFNKYGYIKLKNIFSKNIINKIIEDIYSAKNVKKYYDQNNLIRRIEMIYDKGSDLRNANKKIKNLLKKIFGKDFLIFKDKFNAKPVGGEGFFAHYDGIFEFKDKKKKIKNGWYEYTSEFINVLTALDNCTKKNGTIEVSNAHQNNFEKLLQNTNIDGTPNIKKSILRKLKFKQINLNIGDILIFKNTCPHRSKKNNSKKSRKTLYYTYTLSEYGSYYKKYFNDKKTSLNKNSKSLNGEV
ncbi:phytanoyl-CoA dioxygenase family protein [Candidatus Pelagibacter ubique]|nr:phytanoyl-CoA dioxygenase family protein [Candidatus Pelagibacter ubique]